VVSKPSIGFKVQSSLHELRPTGKAAVRLQPEEYIRYFEDWNRTPNAEIGSEGRF